MAIAQPLSTDGLNSPAHHTLHCIIAADVAAPAESLTVNSDGNVNIASGKSYMINSVAMPTRGRVFGMSLITVS